MFSPWLSAAALRPVRLLTRQPHVFEQPSPSANRRRSRSDGVREMHVVPALARRAGVSAGASISPSNACDTVVFGPLNSVARRGDRVRESPVVRIGQRWFRRRARPGNDRAQPGPGRSRSSQRGRQLRAAHRNSARPLPCPHGGLGPCPTLSLAGAVSARVPHHVCRSLTTAEGALSTGAVRNISFYVDEALSTHTSTWRAEPIARTAGHTVDAGAGSNALHPPRARRPVRAIQTAAPSRSAASDAGCRYDDNGAGARHVSLKPVSRQCPNARRTLPCVPRRRP
jgi:hypothetical protein